MDGWTNLAHINAVITRLVPTSTAKVETVAGGNRSLQATRRGALLARLRTLEMATLKAILLPWQNPFIKIRLSNTTFNTVLHIGGPPGCCCCSMET
uniref:Uncharacterized protein n=1 Tax=Trichuris muris TaxID=70415 RepID=A0A5S6Q959_TRIMR